MTHVKSIIAAACLACAAVGCTPPRTLYVSALKLDETTKASLQGMLGEPTSSVAAADSSGKFERVGYRPDGEVNVREASIDYLNNALFEFRDDRLQAYLLVGPLRPNRVRIDAGTADTIQRGTTTKDALVARFGPPLGQSLAGAALFAPDKGWKPDMGRTLVWADFTNGRNGFFTRDVQMRLLIVDLNPADRVLRTRTVEWKQNVPN